jgi:hypothetical protein
MSTSSVPALLRQQVDRWAETWLRTKFSRLLELRAHLNVRYRARSRRPEDDFVVRHTRLTLIGFGRFELVYFRHTGKWFTVFRGLTAAECFREIEGNEVFWPTT